MSVKPKLLHGREVASYLQQRHSGIVASMTTAPTLAIAYIAGDAASQAYTEVKRRYGEAIGVSVLTFAEDTDTIKNRVTELANNPGVTGIIVQLPIAPQSLQDEVIALIPPSKDIDGLGEESPYDSATAKGIIWLLSAFDIDIHQKTVAVIGQGMLIGMPISRMLEDSQAIVHRIDIDTPNLIAAVSERDIIISATGQEGIVTTQMVKPNAVVIDCGSPKSEITSEVRYRSDLSVSPNPGGVGPMTVACLFDNLIIAAN